MLLLLCALAPTAKTLRPMPMTCVHTVKIRQMLTSATKNEPETLAMVESLAVRAPNLHNAIRLPADAAAQVLADFVVRYIEQVPYCIEALYDIANDADILEQVAPLLKVAIDYFLE